MDIKSLPPDVRKHLRSGINVNSVCQCVTELVLNSLDAKSTAVAVRINLLKFRIQVVDNGRGITKSNMHLVGIRYMTSKCQSVTDLKKLKHFGFRGEALASIRGVSEKLFIQSRAQNVENTCSKTCTNGKWSKVDEVKHRPSEGTTVTIEGFMHNLPVRQKRIKESLDLNETKRVLESLAIIHPNVSFSLRNDVSGKIIMQSKQTQTVSQALINLHPDMSLEDLLEIKVRKSTTSISGLIYKKPYPGTKLQLIYLNKRPITSRKIQKLTNSLLLKSCIFQKSPQVLRHLVISGPAEKNEYPAYVINIRCPYSEIDLTLSPSKRSVEFKQWDVVLNCITKAIVELLKDKHLIDPTFASAKKVNKRELASSNGFQSQFGVSQIGGAVTSVPFKRKRGGDMVELPKKLVKYTSDADNDQRYGNEDIGKEPVASEDLSFGLNNGTVDNVILNNKNVQAKDVQTCNKQKKPKNVVEENDKLISDVEDTVFIAISRNSNNEKNTNEPKIKSCMKKSQRKFNNESNLQSIMSNHGTELASSEIGNINHINDNHPESNQDKHTVQERDSLEVNEKMYNHNVKNQNKNDKKLPISIFDKHANTHSLVLNSDTGSLPLDDNPLLNTTTNTTTLNNQDNGKNLIMEMFLKSTLIYPNEGPEITDSNTVKTVVVKTTNENLVTECRNQNTAINMSVVVSKRTVVTNSMYILQSVDENQQNNRQTNITKRPSTKSMQNPKDNPNIDEKIISKSIQKTMIEQQNELNLNFNCTNQRDSKTTSQFNLSNIAPHNYNITFSKYFRKSHRKKRLKILPKHKSVSQELLSLYHFNDHPFHINVETCRPEIPRFFNNQQESRPIVHFGSFNLNRGKIPRFGSSDYFLKPMTLAINNEYGTENRNLDVGGFSRCNLYPVNTFRRPIQKYTSDYNFNFSNLNVLDEPYKQFLEEQEHFLNPKNYFAPFKRRNLERRFQNSRHDEQAIANCLDFDSWNITVPLYQSYTTRKEELNNYEFGNLQPHYEFSNLTFRNNRETEINNMEAINPTFMFNRVSKAPKSLLPLKNNIENNNYYCEIQRQSKNMAFNHEKPAATIPHPVQYTKENPFSIFNKSCTDTDRFRLEEQRVSPFFRQPSKRNQNQIINHHRNQKHRHHHHNIESNHLRNVPKDLKFTTRVRQNVSPFFRKTANNPASQNKRNLSPFIFKASSSPIDNLVPPNQYFGNLIPNAAGRKREMRSPFHRAEKQYLLHKPLNMAEFIQSDNKQSNDYQQFLPQESNGGTTEQTYIASKFYRPQHQSSQLLNHQQKVLVENGTNDHTIKHGFSPRQKKQNPIQNVYENASFVNEQQQQDGPVKTSKSRDSREEVYLSPRRFFCENSNQIKAQDTFLNYERQQQDVLVKDDTNNDYLEQFCFSSRQKKHHMKQTSSENGNVIFNFDLQQHNPFLQQNENVSHERKYEDTNLPKTEFIAKPFHYKNKEISPSFHISNTNLKTQKQRFCNRESKLSLKRFHTKPPHPNIIDNHQKFPITRSSTSSFNFLEQGRQPHNNFTSENNLEYNVTTPNINMSSTEAVQHVDLDPIEQLDSSLHSINFKPALCSTRMELFEENPAEANLSSSRLKFGTEYRDSDIVEVTPTNFHSFPVPSLVPPPHNLELKNSKTKRCKPISNVNVHSSSENAPIEDNRTEIKEMRQNETNKSPWSPLNISISGAKKTKLIEVELVKDCQLNKKSDSGESDHFTANSVNGDNCNLEKLEYGGGHLGDSNKTVDVQTSLEKEWVQQVNKFGSKFYINKRTGMTSMYSPKQDTSFKFMKRLEFVPKGLSPIFVETKKVDASLSPTSKKFLHEAILKGYEDELNIIKWKNYINDYDDVNKFFEDLYKEKTKQLQYIVPNMIANDLPRSMIKLHKQVQAQSFTKDIFAELEVLGQLDNKFIVTLVKAKKLILLFDQHAVHERVRLEKLLQDYQEQDDNSNHTRKFKSTKCQDPIILDMLEEDLNILEKYKNTFEDLGLSYKRAQNQIEVTHIPTCIYNRFVKGKNNTDDTSLKNFISSLIYEQITTMTSTRGVKSRMPTVLQHVINSKACRGAIKFGDTLTHAECIEHLNMLSECTLPFQCAHGRPTLAPVLSLNHDVPMEQMKPNLRKLKNLRIDTQ